MKNLYYLVLILVLGCKSQSEPINQTSFNSSFDYLETDENFEMEVTEFYKNTAHCGTEGLPYALLIGQPNSSSLPQKISVLSYCDDRIFEKGDRVKIEPTQNPAKRTDLNPIYFIKDTVINGSNQRWVIGSEHKALWGRPIPGN